MFRGGTAKYNSQSSYRTVPLTLVLTHIKVSGTAKDEVRIYLVVIQGKQCCMHLKLISLDSDGSDG